MISFFFLELLIFKESKVFLEKYMQMEKGN